MSENCCGAETLRKTGGSMIRLMRHQKHKRHRKVWHLILAILVAGMPLGMWTSCVCCDATATTEGELARSCCVAVKSCCDTTQSCRQMAPTTSCCKTRSVPCSAIDPCCCRDTPPRQPLTPDVRDDFPVRQSMSVALEKAPESPRCSGAQPRWQTSNLSLTSPLRLHAVLGIWLN